MLFVFYLHVTTTYACLIKGMQTGFSVFSSQKYHVGGRLLLLLLLFDVIIQEMTQ